MKNEVDFDALSRRVNETGMMEDAARLFGHAFALPDWYFIARGQFPNVTPYIASNEGFASGQYMVRAFTDTDRLLRFAQENNLMEAGAAGNEPASLILSVPTDRVVDYLEQFIRQGVYGVWFNSDTKSDGFFVPLTQLRPIKAHLETNSRPSPTVPGNATAGTWAAGDDPRLPKSSDFPPGTEFVIKEFDVPLVQIPGQGWFNWFGGTPRPYNPSSLRVDNNWRADSFEEWVGVVRESLKD
jgi:hypothetical protein